MAYIDQECGGAAEEQPLLVSTPPKSRFLRLFIVALAIGVTDRLGDALRLVAAMVPSFFGGARDDEIPCNKCGNGSLAAPRPPPSAENLQMLHNANALDIALYAYAAERFDAHFDACFPR